MLDKQVLVVVHRKVVLVVLLPILVVLVVMVLEHYSQELMM